MKNPLILIVASEQKAKQILSLLPSDFDGVIACSGQEGIDLYQKNILKIRIVLVDVVLPDMSGLFLLKEVRRVSSLAEVILCSDKADISTVVMAMREGAFDFFLHPISCDFLNERLMSIFCKSSFISRLEQVQNYPFLKLLERNYKFNVMESILSDPLVLEKKLSASDILESIPDPIQEESELSLGSDRSAKFYNLVYAKLEEKVCNAPESSVLIIEDDSAYAMLLQHLLSDHYQVFLAASATEGLAMCYEHSEIGVVVLDLVLPDISGIELISSIKETLTTCEIIALTGFSSWELAVETMKSGATDFLQKPVIKETLLNAISQALARRNRKFVLPAVKKAFFETKMSHADKIQFLKDLGSTRKEKGESVFMEELYALFPELKATFIPGGVCVPSHVYGNLDGFVENLKLRISNFQQG